MAVYQADQAVGILSLPDSRHLAKSPVNFDFEHRFPLNWPKSEARRIAMKHCGKHALFPFLEIRWKSNLYNMIDEHSPNHCTIKVFQSSWRPVPLEVAFEPMLNTNLWNLGPHLIHVGSQRPKNSDQHNVYLSLKTAGGQAVRASNPCSMIVQEYVENLGNPLNITPETGNTLVYQIELLYGELTRLLPGLRMNLDPGFLKQYLKLTESLKSIVQSFSKVCRKKTIANCLLFIKMLRGPGRRLQNLQRSIHKMSHKSSNHDYVEAVKIIQLHVHKEFLQHLASAEFPLLQDKTLCTTTDPWTTFIQEASRQPAPQKRPKVVAH